ncbi:MAG: hypothetical protein QM820_01080 [Minicystis sp.]
MLFPSVMDMKPSTRKTTLSGAIALLVLGGAAFVAASGCSKSEAATSRSTTHESVPVVGGAKAETDNYVAEIKAGSGYKAGAEGAVEVTLATKGAYHTNAQYPYKFKLNDAPDGLSYPKPTLQRADGAFEEKKGTFKVPFNAAKPGKYTIAGVFSLSVCSEANCIMDKVPLEVSVEVK